MDSGDPDIDTWRTEGSNLKENGRLLTEFEWRLNWGRGEWGCQILREEKRRGKWSVLELRDLFLTFNSKYSYMSFKCSGIGRTESASSSNLGDKVVKASHGSPERSADMVECAAQ